MVSGHRGEHSCRRGPCPEPQPLVEECSHHQPQPRGASQSKYPELPCPPISCGYFQRPNPPGSQRARQPRDALLRGPPPQHTARQRSGGGPGWSRTELTQHSILYSEALPCFIFLKNTHHSLVNYCVFNRLALFLSLEP